MGDESEQATIVSNHSSKDSFANLPGAHDGSCDWDPFSMDHNTTSNTNEHSNNTNTTHQPAAAKTSSTDPAPSFTSITMPNNFHSSLIVSNNKSPMPILPSAGLAVPSAPANNTVPEFLYQLTKMLTGGHNDIIEWSNGRIEVHSPNKLESLILQKYFRHSKFASFQRQLNYFGFRKLAGKGKMAPCSYVNEAATKDIGSLLLIKRKATAAPKEKNGRKSATDKSKAASNAVPLSGAKRGGIVHQARSSATPVSYSYNHSINVAPRDGSQQAIAAAAVGRGIRHSIAGIPAAAPAVAQVAESSSNVAPSGVEDSLSQLANNYQNSIGDLPDYPEQANSHGQQQDFNIHAYNDPFPSLLSRNSSLVDLAMIPNFDETELLPSSHGMSFVDFPQPEVDPSKGYHHQHAEGSE